jgi:hypothetical protein
MLDIEVPSVPDSGASQLHVEVLGQQKRAVGGFIRHQRGDGVRDPGVVSGCVRQVPREHERKF